MSKDRPTIRCCAPSVHARGQRSGKRAKIFAKSTPPPKKKKLKKVSLK